MGAQPRLARSAKHLTPTEAIALVRTVCEIAGSRSFVDEVRADLSAHGILRAIRRRDTPALFDWMVATLSYQGISDEVAAGYMRAHGQPRFHDLQAKLSRRWPCPKLQSYWHYAECGYRKGARTCNAPHLVRHCPVPTHTFRNGRLTQMAYSLFLIVRDAMDSDLVGWIDRQLAAADTGRPDRIDQMGAAVVEPLCNVFGASDKVVRMMLAELLLGASRGRPAWVEVGGSLIAIDTLVHNFLHRTGVQAALGKAPSLRASLLWQTRLRGRHQSRSRRNRRNYSQFGLSRQFSAVRAELYLALLRSATL